MRVMLNLSVRFLTMLTKRAYCTKGGNSLGKDVQQGLDYSQSCMPYSFSILEHPDHGHANPFASLTLLIRRGFTLTLYQLEPKTNE